MSINNLNFSEIWKRFDTERQSKYLGWKIASIIVAGMIVLSALLTAGFIYQNIYSTISNSYSIFVLSSELGMDTVDMDMYNKTNNVITAKQTPTEIPADIRNIFNFVDTTSSTISTTKHL